MLEWLNEQSKIFWGGILGVKVWL